MPVREGYSSKKGKSLATPPCGEQVWASNLPAWFTLEKRLFQYSDGRFWCYCPWLDRIEPSEELCQSSFIFQRDAVSYVGYESYFTCPA